MFATSIARGRAPAPVWRRKLLAGACTLALAALLVPVAPTPEAHAVECANSGQGGTVGDDGGHTRNTACGASADASGSSMGNSAFGDSADASGDDSHNTATGFEAHAFGDDSSNSAFGDGADASGNDSTNAATGAFANASGANSSNIALGNTAIASGDGTNNMALGFGAQASNNSIAIGANAVATGSIAAGNFATAGNGGAAFGDFSTATGTNSTAIGPNATASHANAAAFGNGATTTRANQQVFGTASNSYTMPGLTSSHSKSAQGKPTHLVTSNAGGDLAAYTPQQLGLATSGDVAGLQSDIDALGRRDKQLTEGLAAVASMAQPIILPGQTFAMRAGWGNYDDANAVSFTAAGVLAKNLVRPGYGTLVADAGVGVGTNEGEVAGRAGLSFGW